MCTYKLYNNCIQFYLRFPFTNTYCLSNRLVKPLLTFFFLIINWQMKLSLCIACLISE